MGSLSQGITEAATTLPAFCTRPRIVSWSLSGLRTCGQRRSTSTRVAQHTRPERVRTKNYVSSAPDLTRIRKKSPCSPYVLYPTVQPAQTKKRCSLSGLCKCERQPLRKYIRTHSTTPEESADMEQRRCEDALKPCVGICNVRAQTRLMYKWLWFLYTVQYLKS